MSVQVIMKDGLPEWAVVPYQEYARLLEKARLLDQLQPMQPVAVVAEQTAVTASSAVVSTAGGSICAASTCADSTRAVSTTEADPADSSLTAAATGAAPAVVNPAAGFQGSSVAERIREARLQAGLDVTMLARDAGISPSYLQMIEEGSRSASDAILHSLARSLKVPAAQLSGE